MTRLLQSTTGNDTGDPTLQRPVVSFVIQQHCLDSLQLAMRQALRKAACRVFALQVGGHLRIWQCVGSSVGKGSSQNMAVCWGFALQIRGHLRILWRGWV